MAYITKEYLENNIKNYDQYRNLDKEGQANGLATLDANGKLVSTQIPSGVGAATYNGSPVTSIVAGSNTAMSLTNGRLEISSTAAGAGNVPAFTSADKNKVLTVTENKTWDSTTGTYTYTYYTSWEPSPFYEEGTTDNNTFTFALEQYKVAYNYGAPIFTFTGDKGGSEFNASLAAYNDFMSNNGGQAISQEDAEYITSSSFIGLTITCPSNIIFAQLDRPIYAPTNPGYTMNGSIISTIAGGKQQISIKNSNPAIGFPVGSITASNPGYASLKFATDDQLDSNYNIISKGHTYNATIKIEYIEGDEELGISGYFRPTIII